MTSGAFGTVPYIPDLSHLPFDATVSFAVSALLAIMVNAEAQAWMATLLGDLRVDAKDRFHFIVFLHMSFGEVFVTWWRASAGPNPLTLIPVNFDIPGFIPY
jgi:hypothetical protein